MPVVINGTTGIVSPKVNALDLELDSKNVVERGSNANGEYVRYADGTQICAGLVTGFAADAYGLPWLYPATFSAAPRVTANLVLKNTNFGSASLIFRDQGTSATTIFKYADTQTTNTLATDFTLYSVSFLAIGRWY